VPAAVGGADLVELYTGNHRRAADSMIEAVGGTIRRR